MPEASPPSGASGIAPGLPGAAKDVSGRKDPYERSDERSPQDMPFLATEWGWSSRPSHLLKQIQGEGPQGSVKREAPIRDCRHAVSWVGLMLQTVHPNPSPRGKRGGREKDREGRNLRRRERRAGKRTLRERGKEGGGGEVVRVVTWNLQRMSMREANRRKLREVVSFIVSQGWEIVLMSEIYAEEEGVIWLGEGMRRAAVVHGRRTAILLSGAMLERWVEEGENKSFEERVTVVTVMGMRLMAVYQPIWQRGNIEVENFRHQVHNQIAATREREFLVIGGDHNSHIGRDARRDGVVGMWSMNSATNEAGRDLVNWCEENGLAYANSFYRHRYRGTWFSNIHHRWYELDGFLIKQRDRHKRVKKVSTINVTSYSDHKPKMMVVRSKVKAWRSAGRRGRVGQIKWEVLNSREGRESFREATRERWEERRREEGRWEKVAEVMRESAREVCGMRERRIENPWMVGHENTLDELRSLVQRWNERKNELLTRRRTRAVEADIEDAKEHLKEAKKEMKRKLKQWEREWWDEKIRQCEEAQHAGEIGTMYKILKEIGLGNMKRAAASTTLTLEDFRKQFRDVSKDRYEETPRALRRVVEKVKDLREDEEAAEASEFLNETPDNEEIEEEMKKVKDSAPGEDEVRMKYINLACEDVREGVVRLVKFMFETRGETWEESLKSGVVVPIFKKGDRNSSNNYRGVCLLAMASRILGRVLASRLRWWAEKIGLLDENQSGFRKGRSTADATQIMVRIQEDVNDYRKRRQMTGRGDSMEIPEARLLDLRKAYPRINRPVMWGILERYGLHGNMLSTVRDLHETAFYKVKGPAGESKEWQPQRGLRKGCPTSPILFNIYHQAAMRQAEEARREEAE